MTKNLTTIAGIALGAYVAMSIAIGLGLMIGAAAVWLRGGVMSLDKMRAEFEAAITKDCMDAGYDEPNLSMIDWEGAQVYEQNHIQAAWWGWQQSRAALVVELPEKADDFLYGRSWNMALDRCRQRIEAAGVRVKP